MKDISHLQVGDVVQNLGSGNAFEVVSNESGRVLVRREIEIFNSDEWILVGVAPDANRDTPIYQHDKDRDCYELIRQTLRKMRESKPDERSEKARRYAVSITEMEKVLAYFHMYVVNDGAGE